jgi:hypothetical protein
MSALNPLCSCKETGGRSEKRWRGCAASGIGRFHAWLSTPRPANVCWWRPARLWRYATSWPSSSNGSTERLRCSCAEWCTWRHSARRARSGPRYGRHETCMGQMSLTYAIHLRKLNVSCLFERAFPYKPCCSFQLVPATVVVCFPSCVSGATR